MIYSMSDMVRLLSLTFVMFRIARTKGNFCHKVVMNGVNVAIYCRV